MTPESGDYFLHGLDAFNESFFSCEPLCSYFFGARRLLLSFTFFLFSITLRVVVEWGVRRGVCVRYLLEGKVCVQRPKRGRFPSTL